MASAASDTDGSITPTRRSSNWSEWGCKGNPMNTDTHRQCGGCLEVKEMGEYYANKHSPSGVQTYCKECSRMRQREYYKISKGRRHKYKLRYVYGMTVDDYDNMLESQGGSCAICGTSENQRPGHMMHVDHCHLSGSVRGILCAHCNTGLGLFRDNVGFLESAISYLGGQSHQ